jgi:hypothetical protein
LQQLLQELQIRCTRQLVNHTGAADERVCLHTDFIAGPAGRQRMTAQRLQWEMAEHVVRTCIALLITFAAALILLHAELYFSGPSRMASGESTMVEPDAASAQ